MPTSNRRPFATCLCAALVLGCSACLEPPDTVLARHRSFVLAAHDSAHVRTLTIEAAPGVSINAQVQPELTLESGERLSFSDARISADGTRYLDAPSVRVLLSSPANGVLRVSVCKDSETECTPVSLTIQTRGRKVRERG